jgi:hypothetical protein
MSLLLDLVAVAKLRTPPTILLHRAWADLSNLPREESNRSLPDEPKLALRHELTTREAQ